MANRAPKRGTSARAEPARSRGERPARNLTAARLKAHRVKIAFVMTAAAVFVAAMIFARISYAGHAKQKPAVLNVPRRFLRVVKKNRLQTGVVAPPSAPPAVVSSPS